MTTAAQHSTEEQFRQYLADRHDDFAPVDPDKETTGQTRMAYRLAARYKGRLLYIKGLDWHHWDGTRWAEDTSGAATRAVLDVLRRSWREAMGDDKLLKDVKACHSASGVAGVLKIAQGLPEFATTVDTIDPDPYLLNCANGTLDLRTMELRDHDPADRITKVATGAYRPGASGAVWERFLTDTLPDQDIRGFLQRYVGQALVGEVLEHKLAILTGTGGNGKGVWYGAVGFALGDYAVTPQPEMLLSRKGGGAFDGTVELRAARWAVFSEVDKGRALAPGTVKRLTGGDRITARNLYQPLITFEPSHTLAMVVNDLPEVPDMSRGMWRRLLVVPFEVEVPEERMDDSLPEKLQADADAVLSWAVEGWRDYVDRGRSLDPPAAVTSATQQYRSDSDQLTQFLDETTVERTGATVSSSQLWAVYGQWIARAGGVPQFDGRNKLAEAIRDRIGWRTNRQKYWLDHELAPEWNAA